MFLADLISLKTTVRLAHLSLLHSGPVLSQRRTSSWHQFIPIHMPKPATVLHWAGLPTPHKLASKHTVSILTFTFHKKSGCVYHTRAIICPGLYIFYPIFHCRLYCRAVNITDNLCTKQGNSSIFGPKIRAL